MSIGKISEFKVHSDDWSLYVERLEHYFIVNAIRSELHVSTLITVMGAESYELLVNLCTPDKPSTKTFEQLTVVMKKHLQPKPSILAERFKFRQRKQKEGENVADYLAVLKKMSKTCDFGTWLEESIRDQFVCDIGSEVIRQRLFAEDSLDYIKAFKLASSMEAAEQNAAIVEGQVSERATDTAHNMSAECLARTGAQCQVGSVHIRTPSKRGSWQKKGGQGRQLTKREAPRQTEAASEPDRRGGWHRRRPCEACGAAHDTDGCRFARYVCRACNRQGHLQRVCPVASGTHHMQEESVHSDGDDSEEKLESSIKKKYPKDEPASSGESGDESGSEPESPSEKLLQAHKQDWINDNERDSKRDSHNEPQASTSSTTQEADSSKPSQPNLPKLLPKLDLPGGAMLYPSGVLAGFDGIGNNIGLGNLAMGYPHSFILGLANQGQDGASSSNQPQFITIPLSMAMAAAAGAGGAPTTVPANGCPPSASSDDSSELQDLSTGRK